MTSGSDRRVPPGGTQGTRGELRRPSGGSRRAADSRSAGTVAAASDGRRLGRSTLWADQDRPAGPQPLKASWDPLPPPEQRPGKDRPRPERPQRRRSAIGWFFHRYGWRAYALPVLVALTVVAVIQLVRPAGAGTSAGQAPPTHQSGGSVTVTVGTSVPTTVTVQKPATTTTVQEQVTQSAKTGTAVPSLTAEDPNGTFRGIAAGALPPGAAFAKTGEGTFHVVPGTSKPMGHGSKVRTFTVEVEDGIENAAQDTLFADAVVHTLSDDRSWIGGGEFTLRRIDSGKPDFRISLTSQMTVRQPENCGWQIQLEASCYNRLDGRVFINDARWVRGAVSYNGDLGSYRVYAINHEVGHALGYHHQPCPTTGGLAPVMMQQSWSTADDDLAKLDPGGPVPADGKVCKYNPFPYPRGPEDAGSSTSGGTAATSTTSSGSSG